MANSKQNRRQNDSTDRQPVAANRKIEPPRKAPQTERGLTHSPYFNGPLYQRMSDDLHLGGMSKRTHEGYLRAVRQLADFCNLSPDQISEDQLRKFFLHLKNDKSFASGSLRVAFSGMKFFYTRTCRREWQTLAQMKIQNVKSLPEVLTIEQVHQIINCRRTQRMAETVTFKYTPSVMDHDRRSRVTPQIIRTADDAHENTTGERRGVSPPCQPRMDDPFQNTHQALSDRGAR